MESSNLQEAATAAEASTGMLAPNVDGRPRSFEDQR